MQEKTLKILEKLNIEIVYIDKNVYFENEQIVFSTKEKDDDFSDNKSNSVVYNIYITYKYKNLSNVMKYQKIKNLLKENGYIFKNAFDDFKEDFYIKEMFFEIEGELKCLE